MKYCQRNAINSNFILFIYSCAESSLLCTGFRRGYSLLPVPRLLVGVASLVAGCRLRGAPASVAVVNRLGYSAACGIFLDQESNLFSLHWLNHFSCVQLFATLWTVACQAALSMEFSRLYS